MKSIVIDISSIEFNAIHRKWQMSYNKETRFGHVRESSWVLNNMFVSSNPKTV